MHKLIDEVGADNLASHILLSGNNQFIYVANRGPDSLSVFERKSKDGGKTFDWERIQIVKCGGSYPRHFAFTPDEGHIVIANQLGNNVRVLKRNSQNGTLELAETELKLNTPMFILF